MHWGDTASHMAEKGMVAIPLFLGAAVLLELAGGLSVLLGYHARWGAMLLIIFLVPVSLVMHNFWALEGQQMQNQMQHFMKNVTIIGGLLAVAAAGAGRFSLDARAAKSTVRRSEEYAGRETVHSG